MDPVNEMAELLTKVAELEAENATLHNTVVQLEAEKRRDQAALRRYVKEAEHIITTEQVEALAQYFAEQPYKVARPYMLLLGRIAGPAS